VPSSPLLGLWFGDGHPFLLLQRQGQRFHVPYIINICMKSEVWSGFSSSFFL
jgi:hypothetical protein